MSEKVTFQELIDSLAEQTNNSKRFTHAFLKDLVSVINSGLEDDGKVNIAGLGKFKLRQMDERAGYNPQSGEKITIPAHNKVVFKPYKDLRELINAPYANLEPEIIEEEKSDRQQETKEEKQPDTIADQETFRETADHIFKYPEESEEDNDEQEQEFMPPASPSPSASSEETEGDAKDPSAPLEEDENESEPKEDPFGFTAESHEERFAFDEETTAEAESDPEDEDIVEYQPSDESGEKSESAVLDQYLEDIRSEMGKKPESEETARDEKTTEAEEGSKTNAENTHSELTEDSKEPEQRSHVPSVPTSDKKDTTWIWMIAAGAALLVVVLGFWYLNSGIDTAQMPEKLTIEQLQPQNTQSKSETSSEAEPNQQSAASSSQTATTQQQLKKDPVQLEVNEGQTLWSLARIEYEDPYLWPWIYDANQSDIDNPDLIIAGQTLSLPVPDRADYGLSSSDSSEVAIGYIETYHWYKEHGHDKAKFYLWAAKIYDHEIFDEVEKSIDKDDLAFANRVR